MPKKEHDEITAEKFRTINYDKPWFRQGLAVLKKLNLQNFKILDLGCGNGEFAELVQKNFNADITCLDYSESHIERIKSLGLKFIKCDFDSQTDIDFINTQFKKSFDVIVCFEVIEHIFDTDSLLAAAYNILKKDGILIISTPNVAYTGYKIFSLMRENIPVDEGHHIRFFNPRRLKQVLLLNGFDKFQEFNFGKNKYYLDRAEGEKIFSIRHFLSKILFTFFSLIICKSSQSYYSNLMLCAKKSDILPIGLDPAARLSKYEKYSTEEKQKIIVRLLPYRENLFFDEHPGLRKFIDEEKEKLNL